MDRSRLITRVVLPAALITAVLALPVAGLTCEGSSSSIVLRVAGEGKQSENRAPKDTKDKCKRASGARTPAPKGCPDGGERLPSDKRSPLDAAPPLTPLVA